MKLTKEKIEEMSGGQAYITIGTDVQATGGNAARLIVCSSGTLMSKEHQDYGECTTPFRPSKMI